MCYPWMSSQEGGIEGLMEPDLSKAQNDNKFLLLRVFNKFLEIFRKKLCLISNIQIIMLILDIQSVNFIIYALTSRTLLVPDVP